MFMIGFLKPKLERKHEVHAYEISSVDWILFRASGFQ